MSHEKIPLSGIEPINEALRGVFPAFALLAGMQLELFTALSSGPLDSKGLATALKVHEPKLRMLLQVLVMDGFLEMSGTRFRNSQTTEKYIVKGRPDYIGSKHELLSDLWGGMLKIAESIRSGKPCARHEFATMTVEELEQFYRGLHDESRAIGAELSARFDFSECKHLLDVGGGSGGLSLGMLERWPSMKATIVELPQVTPVTEKFTKDSPVADRLTIIPRDPAGPRIAQLLPGPQDVAIMRSLLQVLGPEEAQEMCMQTGEALRPGSPIYIVGMGMMDDSRQSPPWPVYYNLFFLNIYDAGQSYTESEYRTWLENAGFTDFQRMLRADGGGIIRAVRK